MGPMYIGIPYIYLPTPPHEQDVTQGKFLSRVSPRLVATPKLKSPVCSTDYS